MAKRSSSASSARRTPRPAPRGGANPTRGGKRDPGGATARAGWTSLSNHAHVLLLIAKDPEILLREVAARVGITERAVQRIVADLEAGRYIERERRGRCNRYRVHPELPLRHPIEAHRRIASLISLVVDS